MTSTYADILIEYVDRRGNVVTLPDFPRPTDQEWAADPEAAAERNADADEAVTVWMDDHQIGFRRRCSVDGSAVTVNVTGTSWTATCPQGHCWIRTFGENDQYVQVL